MAIATIYAVFLIGIVVAVGSSSAVDSAPKPNIGDVEFSELLVLLSQYLTEVRHDILELKTQLNNTDARISRAEADIQQLPEDLKLNFTSIGEDIIKLNTSVDGVIESVELVKTDFSSQLSRVRSDVTTLQSNVAGVTSRVSTLERTSVTDIKLGTFEEVWIYEGPGYDDQYSYVLTKLNNHNTDHFADT
ncbi:Tail fiber protein S' [Orchesella cincta]|uniref:Tail fiber protein S n=1 Tax=Orchesella cincta TaxID=48709 RepID=A0A1D2MXA8_ORCCI|nr:Tail fiber protein S' [Orchesella cincta]